MEPKEQILRLAKIQELANEVRAATKVTVEAPGEIERIEQNFRERNAEYVAIKDRHEELQTDQRLRNGDLTELEERRKKYMEDLMDVKNQREYAAMLKEIDSVKAQVAENEEVILKDMEEIEKLSGELSTQEEHINTERKQVAEQRAAVEKAASEAQATIEQLGAERTTIEGELPIGVVGQVQRLEGIRAGIFVASVDGGSCSACFVRVRPQMYQEIRQSRAVHRCSSCGRYLYAPKAVAEATATPEASAEAVNGGTV
ncbi:MAG: C4-type zinc ribbon domain-containing protein [Acidobacteriota bacterium]|nr:C4-type zinc ribbon domain-containing protein [Acidobacteriota bacterium]